MVYERLLSLLTKVSILDHTDKQAAWYPDDPNEKDRNHMTNFMAAFARFYPCPWCATDFQENLQKAPVKYVT
jgi:hypothetical protein